MSQAAQISPPSSVYKINVKNVSNVVTVGQYVANWISSHPGMRMELRAIGAGAVCQAVKAVANATQRLDAHGVELISRVTMVDSTPNTAGMITSVIVLTVEVRA